MYNWWHYHLSLKKEESWYGIIQHKAAAGETIVPTLFFVSYKAQNRELSKFLELFLVGQFSILIPFQDRDNN